MPSLGQSARSRLLKIIFYQLMIILGFVLVVLLFKGIKKSASSLGGALAYYLPVCLFIWRNSLQTRLVSPYRFMLTFFLSEGLKLFLCGFLFLMMVQYLAIDLLWALIGLSAAIVAFWVPSALVMLRPEVRL